jgi:hypothetical protein
MAVGTMLLIGAARFSGADEAQSSDDGWRRTENGWEHVELWAAPKNTQSVQFHFGEESAPPRPRWDFHPALLVGTELALMTAAFIVWPAKRRSALDGESRSGAISALKTHRSRREGA